jgi:serine/threonine-protein kinase
MAGALTIRCEYQYEVVRKIFEGGMGVVYEAEQRGVHGFVKRVALKVIREQLARQPAFLENFIGEARLVSDLIHTNIVQTYHLGEDHGRYFIAMELIRGLNLEQFQQRLAGRGVRLPLELAVFITSRIARGLAYAHAKTDADGHLLGIVHRDVSAKNVMLAFEGDVKLTDFGIAKARGFLTHEEGEVAVGKPEYMSPEQADFQITDGRSDLFSAGILLAELLLGKNLFKAATPEQTRARVLACELPDFRQLDSRIDDRLESILRRTLARDRASRYATAGELLHDLEYCIYHQGYGPTNETLGRFLRDLSGTAPPAAVTTSGGGTAVLEHTARIRRLPSA